MPSPGRNGQPPPNANGSLPQERRHRTGFLDLPAEIRIKIYEVLLNDLLRQSRIYKTRYRMMQSQTSLPYTCRQIRHEVNQHFRTRYLGLKL